MKKQNPTLVNYETEWIHNNLSPKDRVYFKANTPIENIIPQLEKHLNQCVPDLNANYNNYAASTVVRFKRLYRNMIPSYKGWQVRYRKPGDKKDYRVILERIGFRARQSKPSLKQTVLKKTMLWTHELDLLIDSVKIKGASSCEIIAQRLNHQISQPRYQRFFKDFRLDLDSLAKNSKKLHQESLNLDCQNNNFCHRFNKDLEKFQVYHKQLDLFLSKDYRVQVFNINDVLQKDKTTKIAKGWRVQFLEADN